MLRIILTASLIALLFSSGTCQLFKKKFKFSAGLGGIWYPQNQGLEPSAIMNLVPQLNLTKDKWTDFSVTLLADLGAGYRIATKNDNRSYLLIQTPLLLEANLGHLATKDFYSSWGLFLGSGIGFSLINDLSQLGFIASAGIRFWLLRKSFTIRYAYLFQPQILNHRNIQTLTLNMNFGSFIEKARKNNVISKFVNPILNFRSKHKQRE